MLAPFKFYRKGQAFIWGVDDAIQAAGAFWTNRDQQHFQERMSSTAWQRGVRDMRKAGINPMLAVSQGGASSPTGGNLENPVGGLSDSVASAVHLRNERKVAEATANKLEQDANVSFNTSNLIEKQFHKLQQDMDQSKWNFEKEQRLIGTQEKYWPIVAEAGMAKARGEARAVNSAADLNEIYKRLEGYEGGKIDILEQFRDLFPKGKGFDFMKYAPEYLREMFQSGASMMMRKGMR